MTQPPVRTPGATPYQGRTAPEGVKQHTQPPSKALGRPEPAMKHEAVRPAQPQENVQKQKVRPEKPKPEDQDQGQGEGGRPKGQDDFGKGRRNLRGMK